MALTEGQFSLDGFIFGSPSDSVVLLSGGWDTASLEYRVQDVPRPLGDGSLFGRDTIEAPTWNFLMGVKHDTDVYSVLEDLFTAWRADAIRSTPGARSELQYVRNGQHRVVFGRSRNISVEPDETQADDFKVVTAQFTLGDPLSYSLTEQSLSLTQVTTTPGTGLVLPAVLPWSLTASTVARSGIITMGSKVSAPFTVELNGPTIGVATDIRVWSADWTLHFGITLKPGDLFSYDTATGQALLNGRRSMANLKGKSTARARITPGSNEVILTSSDTSNTTTASIRWRDVFASH